MEGQREKGWKEKGVEGVEGQRREGFDGERGRLTP